MPVLKTSLYEDSSFIQAPTPNQNIINRNYKQADLDIVKACRPVGGITISDAGWFWAKLKDDRLGQGVVGAYYLVYIKIRANGTFYGSKLAAPEPPFTGHDTPTDDCEI